MAAKYTPVVDPVSDLPAAVTRASLMYFCAVLIPALVVSGAHATHSPRPLDVRAEPTWILRAKVDEQRVATKAAGVTSVAFANDSKTVAAGYRDGKVLQWNLQDGRVQRTLHAPQRPVCCLAFSPDDRLLAVGADDVLLWDLATGECLAKLPSFFSPSSLAFSHSGQYLVAGSTAYGFWTICGAVEDGPKLQRWHLRTTITPDTAVPVLDVRKDPEPSSRENCTNQEGSLDNDVVDVLCTADGRTLVVDCERTSYPNVGQKRCTYQTQVGISQLPERVPRVRFSCSSRIRCASLSRDGKLLAAADGLELFYHAEKRRVFQYGEEITVWETANAKPIHVLKGMNGTISDVAFNGNEKYVAACAKSGAVCLWSLKTGKLLATLPNHGVSAYCLEFSPNGRALAIGDDNARVFVWDIQTIINRRARSDRKQSRAP